MRRSDRQVTDISVIKDILDTCKTASIAMIDGDTPYVIPLNYGYELNDEKLVLYFHCAKEGRKIDVLKANSKVCFAVFNEGETINAKTPCNSGYFYSSIVGNGNVEFIENTAEKCKALTVFVAHQMSKAVEFTDTQANSVCVFKLQVTDFTAKKKPRNI